MSRFQASLEQIDARLTLPQPQRGRVVAELAADLDDLYGTLRAEGLSPAEAERRALQLLLPEGAALEELDRLHQPLYRRVAARLSDRTRLHVERAALLILSLLVVGLTAAGLPRDLLLQDPSPFLIPVVLMGCSGLLVAMVCGLRMFVLGYTSPGEGARGLDLLLLLAVAAPFTAVLGMLIDFYIVAGHIVAEPDRATAILIALLRTDGTLLVSALCLSLLTALSWLLLRGRLAELRVAAAAPGTLTERLTVLPGNHQRDVA